MGSRRQRDARARPREPPGVRARGRRPPAQRPPARAVIEKAMHRITAGSKDQPAMGRGLGIRHQLWEATPKGTATQALNPGPSGLVQALEEVHRWGTQRQASPRREGGAPLRAGGSCSLGAGLALARPTAPSPTRRRTSCSPRTPAPHPRPPLYDHKGIHRAQKSCQIKPTARQGPPAWPGCRSGPGARQRLRWLARNRWAALGASQRC
jgi:hypothetical protein